MQTQDFVSTLNTSAKLIFSLSFQLFILVLQDVAVYAEEWTENEKFGKTHTHTCINGPLSGTTQVSGYQKGETNLDFIGARDSEWQWHQLGHMQIYTSLQTNNHASTTSLSFFTGWMPFLPPNQQRQSTEGDLERQYGRQYKHTRTHTHTRSECIRAPAAE